MTVLSPQLRKVSDLVAEGLTNGEIAERMQLSERTVRGYVPEVYARTGARNRSHLVRLRLMAEGPRPYDPGCVACIERHCQQRGIPISPRECGSLEDRPHCRETAPSSGSGPRDSREFSPQETTNLQ